MGQEKNKKIEEMTTGNFPNLMKILIYSFQVFREDQAGRAKAYYGQTIGSQI